MDIQWKEYIKTYDISKCVDYLKEFPEEDTDDSIRIQVKKRLLELIKDVL